MSNRKKNVLVFNVNGQSIEGHPIGANKFILGDCQDRSIIVNGLEQKLETTGTVLYDRSKDGANRPWLVLDFETGKRIKKSE